MTRLSKTVARLRDLAEDLATAQRRGYGYRVGAVRKWATGLVIKGNDGKWHPHDPAKPSAASAAASSISKERPQHVLQVLDYASSPKQHRDDAALDKALNGLKATGVPEKNIHAIKKMLGKLNGLNDDGGSAAMSARAPLIRKIQRKADPLV